MRRKIMHEVSIALGMIDELSKIAREHNARKITAINVKIGRISGIVTDCFKFAFDTVKLDFPLFSSAEIFIQEIPLMYTCNDCEQSFKKDEFNFSNCPACNSYNVTMVSGEELNIENIEVES
jgi:hydrogenase nickel incorporation protein HypA/HybF